MDPAKATAAFPVLLQRLRDVIRRHDPSGLFGIGAPADEHDDAIHELISALQHTHGADEVSPILESVLGGWISANGDDPATVRRAMAPEVWSAWQAFRREAG